MTPEEAYEEALRRIREAKETGAVRLDFTGFLLDRLPRELGHLTSLRSLDLSFCREHSGDISSLTGADLLQSLKLTGCGQLSDLVPLAGLTSLQSLELTMCEELSDLGPLVGPTRKS